MDFSLTEDQVLLRDTARALLAKECPISLIRSHIEDPSAAGPLWEHLRDWVALGGAPITDLAVFCEETGEALAPGPFFPTTALLAPVLEAIEHPLHPDVLAGKVSGTVVLGAPLLGFALEADRVDVIASVDIDSGNVALFEGPTLRQVETIDPSRRIFQVDLAGSRATSETVADRTLLATALQRATVALAADMIGTARWMFDASLEYAKTRVQFDHPIGSFQAIQHRLADLGLLVERARAAVYYAAMAVDAEDSDAPRAVHAAKAAAGRAAIAAARDGISIHGGIGYTWECDLHLFMRRAYGAEAMLGTTAWHHDRLADIVLA